MTMDEMIKKARHSYEQLTVDKGQFEAKFSQRLEGVLERPAGFTKKQKLLILLPIIILPLAAFAPLTYKWLGIQIGVGQSQEKAPYPLSKVFTPIDPSYEKQLLKQPGTKFDTLEQSRSEANFPIKHPDKINGWERITSQGVIFPDYHRDPGKPVYVTDSPLIYLDIYQDEHGQKVSVTQEYVGTMPKIALGLDGYSVVLRDFSQDDFAYLITDSGGTKKKELRLYHKYSDNKVTQFTIDGYVGTSELKMFAHDYLKSPLH